MKIIIFHFASCYQSDLITVCNVSQNSHQFIWSRIRKNADYMSWIHESIFCRFFLNWWTIFTERDHSSIASDKTRERTSLDVFFSASRNDSGRLRRFRGRERAKDPGEFIAHLAWFYLEKSRGRESAVNNPRGARFVAAYEICLVTRSSHTLLLPSL